MHGVVRNAQSGKPLPFVNVGYGYEGRGVVTDVSGKFTLSTPTPVARLIVSNLGYRVDTLSLSPEVYARQPLRIALYPVEYDIEAVYVSPGVNPAHRIVLAAIARKDEHNPAMLPQYSLMSYSKIAAYFQQDSATRTDSSLERVYDTARQGYQLFITETVARREHERGKSPVESVLSSRTSGFQRQSLYVMSSSLQSLSFYDDELILVGQPFLNPLSQRGFKRYAFQLEDSLVNLSGDTIFTISFRPKRGGEVRAISGVMQITTQGFALTIVRATVAQSSDYPFGVTIEQRYELVGSRRWFPVELATRLTVNMLSGLYLDGLTTLREMNFDTLTVGRSARSVDFIISTPSHQERDSLLASYRHSPLSPVEQSTYRLIDSVGEEVGLDRLVEGVSSLMSGKISIGYVQIPLFSVLDYNEFEGFALGIGLESSPRVTKHFTLGGFYRYGFRDKHHKYEGFLEFHPFKRYDAHLRLQYAHEVAVPGGLSPLEDGNMAKAQLMANRFYVPQMDYVNSYAVQFSMRLPAHMRIRLGVEYVEVDNLTGWGYHEPLNGGVRIGTAEDYPLLLPSVRLEYLPGERRALYSDGLRAVVPSQTRLVLEVTHGMRGFSHQQNFTKAELFLRTLLSSSTHGSLNLQARGGFILGDYPLSQGFSNWGTDGRFFAFASYTNFTTLPVHSFYHDYYFDFHALYDTLPWLSLRIMKGWRPALAMAFNAGWGGQWNSMQTAHGLSLPDMGRGFFEAGIGISGILPALSDFYGRPLLMLEYRLPPYGASNWKDNLALVLMFKLSF